MTAVPPTGKIRVLVVDDSVVVRKMVSEVLSEDPAILVVGSAANGKIGLSKIPQVNPDLVTLDIEMPEMDGLATLAGIRKTWPRLPVIMFSTLTRRGAAATLDALALGANDYVTKPERVENTAAAAQFLRRELIPRIKALCHRTTLQPAAGHSAVAAAMAATAAAAARAPAGVRPPSKAVEIVTIGVSTGGPNALATVIPSLPADFPVPVVIVQHMPPMFTRLLAERLASQSSIRVAEATEGAVLEPGLALVAPGDHHMLLRRDVRGVSVVLNQDPPENSCRPAVDVLFRSVAQVYGASALAVVLTGMGQDGLHGCSRIREAGGQILVQDEATSVVWGMPGYVANAGLADAVLPIQEVAPAIVRRARERRAG
jgi:two-component system chemotaxis response regulator CheB